MRFLNYLSLYIVGPHQEKSEEVCIIVQHVKRPKKGSDHNCRPFMILETFKCTAPAG